MRNNRRRTGISVVLRLLFSSGLVFVSNAQVSGPPTATCHVTDGRFTTCPNGQVEWSDVQPVAFPATNSFLYVNQDAAHSFLYLMYDLPFRTTPLAASDSVHINFDTVETESGAPALIVYDIYIYGNGTMQVLQQGQPTPAGSIVGAAGFGASPNSSTPHVIAELQVPLAAGLPPSTYSPDPLFWSATVPPTTPPPPAPCPTQPGKVYNDCVKSDANATALNYALASGALGTAAYACTAATLLACTPAETPLFLAAAGMAGFAAEMAKIAGDPPGFVVTIPPDSNFTVVAQPVVYSPSIPTTGMVPGEAAALNAFFTNLEQASAFLHAADTSIGRAEGATLAGNAVWVKNQTQAAQQYAAQAAPLISAFPAFLANVATAFQTAGTEFTITPNGVLTLQSAINPISPSSEAQQEFVLGEQFLTQLGFTSGDLAIVQELLQAADPQAAAELGIGTFPRLLTDPSLVTVSQQMGSVLTPNTYTVNLSVGVGSLTGTITTDGTIGALTATNVASWGLTLYDGQTTVELTPANSVAEIALHTGLIATSTQLTFNWSSGDQFTFVNSLMTEAVCFSSAADGYCLGYAGGHPSTLQISDLGGDGIVLTQAESGIQVIATATPVVTTTPITTASAAVVQANPSGDTVVSLRGLSPSDTPTITDEIAMIVQFRTIQNPSISGPALTTQLVNGLTNDGVISPSQAAAIQANVLQNLVTPLGSLSLQAGTIVALGQSAQIPVTLSPPASAGGVTVMMTSSNPSQVAVTPSVFVQAGDTTPRNAQAVLSGLNLGIAAITASAAGYTSTSQQVAVTGSLSFSRALYMFVSETQPGTLTLSGLAPAGGLTVSLTSSNTSVATVPATVTFDPGTTSVNIPITGVAAGQSTITASSGLPTLVGATLNVTVSN